MGRRRDLRLPAVGLCVLGGLQSVLGPILGLVRTFDAIASAPAPSPSMLESGVLKSLLRGLPGPAALVAGLLWLAAASRPEDPEPPP